MSIVLQRIPLFLPIIRSSLSTTHPREPDIVDRLDTGALQRMVSLLQDVMRHSAESIAGQQNQLALATKEVDSQLAAIMAALTERQKQYARHAEKLARIHEVSHSLSRYGKHLCYPHTYSYILPRCFPLQSILSIMAPNQFKPLTNQFRVLL